MAKRMAKRYQVVFIPAKSKGKRGAIVVRDKKGALVVRIPVSPSFNPGTIFFEAHCCDGALSKCKKKTTDFCPPERPITVFQ